ncbi:MAG: hypothetical protein DCC71_10550 [Proteobacteria bacterium]|nr:MAG: hypothetical protein DCC71_10550 [Pseudomonadota bacterium]
MVALAPLLAAPAQATILLFDQARDATSGTLVVPTTSGATLPSDYGDGVTSAATAVPGGVFTYGNGGEGFTPDVTVDISSAAATPTDPAVRLWQTGYGDLVNLVFADGPGTAGSPELTIRLSAAPGFLVDLYGFDLAAFFADQTIAEVEVLAGAATLFAASDVLVESSTHTSFAFAAPLTAPELVVRLDFSNLPPGIQDDVGIDSIRFGQSIVPEPGTATLVLCGLASAAAVRRRRAPADRPRG